MGLVRLPCFFNCVQRIERYSTTSSKMIKKWNWWSFFIFTQFQTLETGPRSSHWDIDLAPTPVPQHAKSKMVLILMLTDAITDAMLVRRLHVEDRRHTRNLWRYGTYWIPEYGKDKWMNLFIGMHQNTSKTVSAFHASRCRCVTVNFLVLGL